MVTHQPVVRAVNLSKSYGPARAAVRAVRGVSVSVDPSSLVALAGPSGSGKTTLLNLIGCLDRPDAGEIWIEGRNISTLTAGALNALRRDRLGFVFQTFNLIPVLTAFENVEYPLLLSGASAAGRRDRVGELLEQVGLGGKERRRPNELSGGERQRVAIARALANQPALVLADEPTANLDSANGAAILDLMDDLRDRRGVSFLFASHDARLLDRMDRVVQLTDGAVEEALCA
jgi:putative ABC transport system ATP-binding protein